MKKANSLLRSMIPQLCKILENLLPRCLYNPWNDSCKGDKVTTLFRPSQICDLTTAKDQRKPPPNILYNPSSDSGKVTTHIQPQKTHLPHHHNQGHNTVMPRKPFPNTICSNLTKCVKGLRKLKSVTYRRRFLKPSAKKFNKKIQKVVICVSCFSVSNGKTLSWSRLTPKRHG
jgi:hypothetical protein